MTLLVMPHKKKDSQPKSNLGTNLEALQVEYIFTTIL